MTHATLVIYAPNISRGGGKTLLLSLLRAARALTRCIVFADSRLALPVEITSGFTLHRVEPTVFGRLRAEWRLKSLAWEDRIVLCFGNLPPLYALDSRVFLFVQNRYLCEPIPLSGFPWKTRARLIAERVILRGLAHHANAVVVQTPSMKTCVHSALGVEAVLAPFFEGGSTFAQVQVRHVPGIAPAKKFLYVASGEPHKNHEILLEAWRLLAAEGVAAELHLTLAEEEFDALRARRDFSASGYEVTIINHGGIEHEKLRTLYREVDALIYPSTVESLGLPLIEARLAGLPVIAPELDYVRDVVVPEQTFDPGSAVSIARAVKRFSGMEEKPLPLTEPAEFLRRIISGEI